MTRSVYMNGDYTFFSKDDAVNLYHTYVFDESVTRDTFDFDTILSKIKVNGGYLITKKGDQYSAGEYYSCSDYYIHKDFSACVYNTKKTDHLYIDTRVDDPTKVILPSDLTPTHYLATSACRALGVPFLTYAGVGSDVYATIDFGTISGIDADFYMLKGYELLGAYGVKEQRVPWLYYPVNKFAARGMHLVLTRDVGYDTVDTSKLGNFSSSYLSPDIGTDGVLFTSSTRKGVASAKNQIQKALELTNTAWAARYKRPLWSNDSVTGTFQFAIPSKEGVEEAIDGVIFFGANGVSTLDSAVAANIAQKASKLESPHGYIVDSKLNRIFREGENLYNKKLEEYWKSKYEEVASEVNVFLSTAYGEVCVIMQQTLSEYLLKACQKQLSNFASGSTEAVFTNSLSITPDYGTSPTLTAASTEGYMQFVQDSLSLYGADATVDNPHISFGPLTRDAVRNDVKSKIVGRISDQCSEALDVFFDHFAKGTLTLLNNTCKNKYWCFGTKTQKHKIYQKTQFEGLSRYCKVTNVDISTVDPLHGVGRIKIIIEADFQNKIWYGCKNRDWSADYRPVLQDFLPAGVTINILSSTTIEDGGYHFIPGVTDVKGLLGLKKLRFKYDKEVGKNWCKTGTLRFEVSKDFNYEAEYKVSYGQCQVDSIMQNLKTAGNSLAAVEMIKYFASHLDVIKEASKQTPIVMVNSHYLDPIVAKQFFNVPTIWFSEHLESVSKLALQAGLSNEIVNQVVDVFNDLKNIMGTSDVSTVHWLSEKDALRGTPVSDPNLIPLYVFYGGV